MAVEAEDPKQTAQAGKVALDHTFKIGEATKAPGLQILGCE